MTPDGPRFNLVPPTRYNVMSLNRCYGDVFSTDRHAIRQSVIAAVNDWLDEVQNVPRESLPGSPLVELRIRVSP